MSQPLRLGTRRSALATAQSAQVAAALEKVSGRRVELVPIVSEGDTNRASLAEIGGVGIFATALREALRRGECDFLVHSLKDLPTVIPEDLCLAATPERERANDVVITRDGTALHEMAQGSRVGTGSPRRIAQLRGLAPKTSAVDIRGNVDSRLDRVRTGDLDAVILAAAGLARLSTRTDAPHPIAGLHRVDLGLAEWPTAPGQGALGVETLADAPEDLMVHLRQLDHEATRIAITAERAVLAGLDVGCQSPMAAHASVTNNILRVRAVVYAPADGWRIGLDVTETLNGGYIQGNGSGNGADTVDGAHPIVAAEQVGFDIARRLLERGAADLLPRERSQ
ncbi:hydroxymethylbilane synthase [Microbacterium sp. YY-01]|uniref:hydroxymethylbilane synthase n=1 Tax=Microbacterium sp. YY-01 TaxID=3421634 RepID=UPI003D16B28F